MYNKMLLVLLSVMFMMTMYTSIGSSVEPILNMNFSVNPFTAGWEPKNSAFTNESATGPFGVAIESEKDRGLYLVVKKGCVQSPLIPIVPSQYYKLSYTSKVAGKAYWGFAFFDKNGKELQSDIYDTIQASTEWQPDSYCIRAHPMAASMRLRLQTIDDVAISIDDIRIEPIDIDGVANWIDQFVATLPPLSFTPAADRWKYLPRTMKTLQEGGKLRIVMLGDSICNDTSYSLYEALLHRYYPKTQIEVITSVRSGTGCSYYKLDNHVQEYVIQYHPDLLIIGGLGNSRDAESNRSVIQQVHAASNCEIMVLSASTCPLDENHQTLNQQHKPLTAVLQYSADFTKMAAEEKVEFFDNHAAWDAYILSQSHPQEWFQRDMVHSGSRGKQIVGQILARFFAPKQ